MNPVLMLGAGRLGGALIEGWLRFGGPAAGDLMILDPSPSESALGAIQAGALRDPGPGAIARAGTVLLAVKPQAWREAVVAVAPHLPPDAVIVSVVAGVRAADISEALGGRRVARRLGRPPTPDLVKVASPNKSPHPAGTPRTQQRQLKR